MPYTAMEYTDTDTCLRSQRLSGECDVSESRMREIRLSGSVGGLLMYDILFMSALGGLP